MGEKRDAPKSGEPSDEDLLNKYGALAEEYAAVREESAALAGKDEESAAWHMRKSRLADAVIKRKSGD